MRREEWRFEYTANNLAAAAEKKIKFHAERLEWWKSKRHEVMDKIRSEGIEIDEKISLAYLSPKSRDWAQSTQVTIRDDLRNNLSECQEKLAHHTQKQHEYVGWQQILAANPEQRLRLDIHDWLFFFDRI